MTIALTDVTGFRGERIVELCLTDYRSFPKPLFRPGFLGDKWPAIDYYVELTETSGERLYFFAQVKSTAATLGARATALRVGTRKKDIQRLLEIPGPTYILGVHEPTARVFAHAVHSATPAKAIRRIPLTYELTSSNLRALHDEVRNFWIGSLMKPTTSVFS